MYHQTAWIIFNVATLITFVPRSRFNVATFVTFDSYGKIHGMAKAMGVSMAKPIVPRVCDSYGKTHGMANAMGVSMAKPMGPNF